MGEGCFQAGSLEGTSCGRMLTVPDSVLYLTNLWLVRWQLTIALLDKGSGCE